jgi:hypothetical protein
MQSGRRVGAGAQRNASDVLVAVTHIPRRARSRELSDDRCRRVAGENGMNHGGRSHEAMRARKSSAFAYKDGLGDSIRHKMKIFSGVSPVTVKFRLETDEETSGAKKLTEFWKLFLTNY